VNISLRPPDEFIESLRGAAGAMLGARVDSLERVAGGRNSQIYRLTVDPGQSYALKVYFRHSSDNRARLETEYSSLTFLRTNGIPNVPGPVKISPENNCAIYEWIDGQKLGSADITDQLIDRAASFLAQLHELRDRPGSHSLPAASEACFSGQALVDNLQHRLRPLLAQKDYPDLQAFLSGELAAGYEQIVARSRRLQGADFSRDLATADRTLSPSDFGFHNALRKPGGEIVFLDFEYFGWDDPVKMISDFLLHPALNLSLESRRHFTGSLIQSLKTNGGLVGRLQAFYPLFGLKWCLILLNEFLPAQMERRRFAEKAEESWPQKQSEQLAKSKAMLQRILSENERFPYYP
jgi:hypothetical protein